MAIKERLRVRPTVAEVDLSAFRHNWNAVCALAGKTEVMAVVKANGYGHGAVTIGRAAVAQGASLLGVALVEEGVELREAGIGVPVVVLGGAYEGGYEAMVEHALWPAIFRPEHLEGLALAARSRGVQATAHLKVDTGMGRIGVPPEGVEPFLARAAKTPEVKLDGLLSHFANADLADAELTREQIRLFRSAIDRMRAAGHSPRYRHLSNSAGVIDLPEVRDGLELNLVRPGLMLYGLAPAGWMAGRVALKPVMRWKTAVTHVKAVPTGTPISYGSTWRATRPSLIATMPIGYADGYSRMFSSKAQVLVRGQRAPVAGRVCMDNTMIDVTDVPGVAVGDEVVLMGAQGGKTIAAEELAGWAGTISYEIVCGVGARVPRVVIG